jgi:hypothetical protein
MHRIRKSSFPWVSRLTIYSLWFLTVLLACESESKTAKRYRRFPQAIQTGKFIERDGVKYLWGGDDPERHFVIDNLELEPSQFFFGVGREHFPALIEPEFVFAADASIWLPDSSRVVGLIGSEIEKAYPLSLLGQHEVVNDVNDGAPIVVIYCNLADLAAIYHATFEGRRHTFGQAGYLYRDPGVWEGEYGFVLWDRETESLWWPLIEKAVSGSMLGTRMRLYDEDKWLRTRWGDWKREHPGTLVLQRGQDFERPQHWPQYEKE